MAAWDDAPIVQPADQSVQANVPFQPVSGPKNALMPGTMKVLTTVPAKPRASGPITYRAATDDEKAQYPGVQQVGSNGKLVMGKANTGADATPESIDTLTDKYLATGEVPATGMGGLDFKTKIFNNASDRLTALGLTGADASAEQAKYKANAGALNDNVKRRTQIAGYEGTAQDSLNLAQQWAKKALPNTGFVTLNKAENWYKSETSDPDMKSLKDATQTVTQEYAKIMSGATNGSITSDQARTRADEMLSAADSPQAYAAAVKILQQEMKFRIDNLDRQTQGLSDQMHKGIGSMAAVGDYRAFTKAWSDKNQGDTTGAQQAWMDYKRKGDTSVPWRQAFPNLKPATVAAPATSAGGLGKPRMRRFNPDTQSLEDVN